jgi:hypothetical protein
MKNKLAGILFLCVILLSGCSRSTGSASSTAVPAQSLVPILTRTASHRPTKTPMTFATLPLIYTSTPQPVVPYGWFPIEYLSSPEAIDVSTARSYIDYRIPPLPEGLIEEFTSDQPYGEVPGWTTLYQVFLIRKGNARMLWLGIRYNEASETYGTQFGIKDAIPLPPTEEGDVLAPFSCLFNNQPDLFLIAVVARPGDGTAPFIRYAWRINQTDDTLKTISTEGIDCSILW